MVRARLIMCAAIAALMLVALQFEGLGDAQTKDRKVITETPHGGEKSRGDAKDANIKTARSANRENASVQAPPEKSEGKPRGRGGYTTIDNWTPWYIDIYADGVFQGTVGPWADGWIYTGNLCPRLYGRADFTDGSYKYWGPREICQDTWKLTK